MARQKYTVPILPAEDTLAAIVDYLRDPDAVNRHLDQIRAARDEAEARINMIGPVEDIERLRSEAAADRAKAETLLRSAEASASDIRARAQADIKTQRSAFEAERDTTTGRLTDRERSVAARERAVSERERFVETRSTEVETAIAAAKAKAMKDVGDVAADTAAEIVAELTGNKVTKAAAAKAIADLKG